MTREELLSAYLDEELAADERSLVERMLAEDEGYRRLADELCAGRRYLAALPRSALGDEFFNRVWSQVEQARPGGGAGLAPSSPLVASGAAPPPAATIGKWIAWPLAAVAAGLLLLVSQRSGPGPGHSELARRNATAGDATVLPDRLHRGEGQIESAGGRVLMAAPDATDFARRGGAAATSLASSDVDKDVESNAAAAPGQAFAEVPASAAALPPRELDRRLGAPSRAQAKALNLIFFDQASAEREKLEANGGQSSAAGVPSAELNDAAQRRAKSQAVEIPQTAGTDDSPVVVVHVAVSSLRHGIPALKSALGRQDIQVEDVAESLVEAADSLRKSPGAPPDGPPSKPRLPYVVEGVTPSQIDGALHELQNNNPEVQRVEVIQDGSDAASNVWWNRLVQGQEAFFQDRMAPGTTETAGAIVGRTLRLSEPNQDSAEPLPQQAPREAERRQFTRGRNRSFQGGYGGIGSVLTPLVEMPKGRGLGLQSDRRPPDGELKAVFLLEAAEPVHAVPAAPASPP